MTHVLRYTARTHSYWLDGKRCKSPSSVAKVPDDASALSAWKVRNVLRGVALQPSQFLPRIAAADDRGLDAIAEEALTVAGGTTGRDRGTAIHTILESIDGAASLLDTDEVRTLRQQWADLLAAHGLTIVAAERVILHPDLRIAGRFDRLVSTSDGRRFILDVKTGASADKYVAATSVQMWLYASAPLMGVGPQGDHDFEVTEWEALENVDQTVGLIAHFPEDGAPRIIPIDIAAGGRCFHEVIEPVWQWRSLASSGALVVDMPAPVPAPMPEPRSSLTIFAEPPAPSLGRWWSGSPTGRPQLSQHTDDILRAEDDTDADADKLAATKADYEALGKDDRDRVTAWALQAKGAGRSLSLKDRPSARRLAILQAVIAWLPFVDPFAPDADDVVRAGIASVIGDDDAQTHPVGALFGSLTTAEAHGVAAVERLLRSGLIAIQWHDGRPVIRAEAA